MTRADATVRTKAPLVDLNAPAILHEAQRKSWLPHALELQRLNLREVRGPGVNPNIARLWALHGRNPATVDDDGDAWCGVAAGAVLIMSGRKAPKRFNLARAYDDDIVGAPCGYEIGAFVVLWRERRDSWKGHVGILVGTLPDGRIVLLGGNQGNDFDLAAFPLDRVLARRMPALTP